MTTADRTAVPVPAPAASGPPRRRRRRFTREALAGYAFISPWIIGFLIFTVISMSYSAFLSMTDYDLATNEAPWVGGANYAQLIDDPKVLQSLGNTFTFALMSVPLETAFALMLALLLMSIPRGQGFFRVLYYLPKMTPAVATAAVFLLLLNGNRGAVNQFLAIFNIPGPQWLIDPDWIIPSIVLMSAWAVAGSMIIYMAALQGVPTDLYEAAALDGAGPVRRFWKITIPLISPTTFFLVVTNTITSLQVFDQAYLLFYRDTSSSAPSASLFYGIHLYQQAFQQFNFGLAAAMAWVLFVIIMIITLIQIRVSKRLVHYQGE
ncbi:carbohydrate ABC transporter permease [Brachybacterium sp. GCM10030267]|uniref:carbohydrate ABC transporter permease n=1 Tax=unclassified Brachybacterium TaxID=2623841 RepID=UPI00360CF6F1